MSGRCICICFDLAFNGEHKHEFSVGNSNIAYDALGLHDWTFEYLIGLKTILHSKKPSNCEHLHFDFYES